jgi:hypothetical protein
LEDRIAEVSKKKTKESKAARKKRKAAEEKAEQGAVSQAYLDAVKGFTTSSDGNTDGEGGKWLVR